jgi:hypothetical protein
MRCAWLPPIGQETEQLPDGRGGDSGPRHGGGTIGAVGGGRREAEDDPVSVLDFEGEGLAWRAALEGDRERAAEEGVERINDSNSLD